MRTVFIIYIVTGKDRKSYWRKHAPKPKNIRTRQENIIVRLPGPTPATKNLQEPLDIWNYFMDKNIISLIVENTNKYIVSIQQNYSRERDANATDEFEIRALFGLLYLAGLSHANRLNLEDVWSREGYGVEIFYLTMTLQRFRFLLRHLRFDDKETRADRRKFDKLAPIRQVFELFIANCRKGYYHSPFVTVDEILAGFRGRCSFRQYIPSKPNKYGLKILAVSDAKMFYTSNLEVYVGSQPNGPFQKSNSPTDVVLRLCDHISGTCRNITMDNWFTSIPLVQILLREHKLTVIGTLRKNKRELPLEFSKPINRKIHSSMFGFTSDLTLVSYIPRRGKNVLLVSSLHHHDEIDPSTGNQNKPFIITEYNETKGGVDVVDKLCASYDCARNTRRWPMVIFFNMLNIAGINAQVIFSANNPDTDIRRRFFLRKMANGLIAPHLQRRASMTNLPRALKFRLQEMVGAEAADQQQNIIPGRCSYCDSKKNRKSRFSCFKCNVYMCLEHITPICTTCRESAFQNE